MYNFTYQRVATLDEARSALAGGDDVKLLAGGHSLLPTMKQRLAAPTTLLDLSGVSGLDGISEDGGRLVVGAMTRHADVASSELVKSTIPALAAVAEGIGDPQVRNRGTIGGSVAHADPAADYPAALVGLGATVHTNKREIGADDFFTGLFETALEDDEIITKVSFPTPEKAAYSKFPNPASRYAVVGVFVAKGGDGVRVAVTGAGSSVFRVAEMESALAASFTRDSVANVAVASDEKA